MAFASTFLFNFLHYSVRLLFPVEVFSNSVLSRELLVHSLGELHDCHSGQFHGGHGVEDRFVGDGRLAGQYFAVLSGLEPVDVLLFPQSDCNHWCADVDQQRSRQAAS